MIYYGIMKTLEHNNHTDKEQILLPFERRERILSNLFSQKGSQEEKIKAEEEFDSSFLYEKKWSDLWPKLAESDNYPYTKTEVELLDKLVNNSEFVEAFTNSEQMIDSGSWNGKKGARILQLMNEKLGKKYPGLYLGEDKSLEMRDQIRKTFRDLNLEDNLWGFLVTNDTNSMANQFKKNLYLFLWCTIWNMSDENIIKKLKSMNSNTILSWNKILLSYYKAPENEEEINKLIEIYKSKEDIAFHENGMKMLWLSENDFEYDVIYEKNDKEKKSWPFPWKIKWVIRAKRDMDKLELTDWKIINTKIKAWQEFTIHYSRRFSNKEIKKLFKDSGCSIKSRVDGDGVSLVLLHKKPTKISKFIAKNNKLLSLLLIWALSFWSGVFVNQRYQKSEIEKTRIDDLKRHKDYHEMTGSCSRFMPTYPIDYIHEQGLDLLAKYDISRCIAEEYNIDADSYYEINGVVDMYENVAKMAYKFWETYLLSSEEFARTCRGDVIDKYHIPYQKPYAHFSEYKDIIQNTLRFWGRDISRYKIKEVHKYSKWIETKLWYYMNIPNQFFGDFYNLKICKVYLDNWECFELFVAYNNHGSCKTWEPIEKFSSRDWFNCMRDLVNKYPYVLYNNQS